MRITSKGQVTIPQAIRDKAGLHPHTEVEFELAGGKVTLRRAGKKNPKAGKPPARAHEAVERLRGTLKHIRLSTDQIMALTRDKD